MIFQLIFGQLAAFSLNLLKVKSFSKVTRRLDNFIKSFLLLEHLLLKTSLNLLIYHFIK